MIISARHLPWLYFPLNNYSYCLPWNGSCCGILYLCLASFSSSINRTTEKNKKCIGRPALMPKGMSRMWVKKSSESMDIWSYNDNCTDEQCSRRGGRLPPAMWMNVNAENRLECIRCSMNNPNEDLNMMKNKLTQIRIAFSMAAIEAEPSDTLRL